MPCTSFYTPLTPHGRMPRTFPSSLPPVFNFVCLSFHVPCVPFFHHSVMFTVSLIPYHSVLFHTVPFHVNPSRAVHYSTNPFRPTTCHHIPFRTLPYRTVPYHPVHLPFTTVPYQPCLPKPFPSLSSPAQGKISRAPRHRLIESTKPPQAGRRFLSTRPLLVTNFFRPTPTRTHIHR